MQREGISQRLELALRWSARWHDGQRRKGGDIPYFQHAAAVAMILDRAGFDEDVVIAGVLHDVVEDTAATCADITQRFGPWAADLVRQCSEIKTDAQGRKRPWIDRKRDHLAALAKASMAVRGVILADKLHNLISIELDLDEGRPVWSLFNADRSRVLWYYQATIETCDGADPRVHALATMCREVLTRIESRG